MVVRVNGAGSITGLEAGGLPDSSITTAEIADAAVTAGKLSTGAPSWTSGGVLSFNSGYGSVATAYGCRAWVNFDGTGTVAIRASGNVSSITDNGTGDYTVNFTTAMPDANYSTVASTARDSVSYWDNLVSLYPVGQYSTAGVRILTAAMSAQQDRYYVTVAIFR